MMILTLTGILAENSWWSNTINYQLIKGNEIWRFALLLLVVLAAMAAGRIVQYAINSYALRKEKKRGITVLTLFLKCLSRPVSVAIFALQALSGFRRQNGYTCC